MSTSSIFVLPFPSNEQSSKHSTLVVFVCRSMHPESQPLAPSMEHLRSRHAQRQNMPSKQPASAMFFLVVKKSTWNLSTH